MKKFIILPVCALFAFSTFACDSDEELVANTPAQKVALHQADCMNKAPTQAQLDTAADIWKESYNTVSTACSSKVDDYLLCISKADCSYFNEKNSKLCEAELNAQVQCALDNPKE